MLIKAVSMLCLHLCDFRFQSILASPSFFCALISSERGEPGDEVTISMEREGGREVEREIECT